MEMIELMKMKILYVKSAKKDSRGALKNRRLKRTEVRKRTEFRSRKSVIFVCGLV